MDVSAGVCVCIILEEQGRNSASTEWRSGKNFREVETM